jgi:transketolase
MKIVSRVHAHNLVRWAKSKPEVLVFSADLTGSTEIDLFRAAYPKRFFSFGVAEQNMMSFAGGMAREGFFPFVHTFGVFMYRRAYDQIAMSIAYPCLPVRMFGFLPGVTTPGGATHQGIEDISIMRSLPHMTVLECGDATEVESVLDAAHAVKGPVYIRMLRGDIPRLFDARQPMRLGKARILSRGKDITVLSSGICTEEAMRAIHLLKEKGVSISHLHVSTLKPFHDQTVLKALAKNKHGVITMENHSIIGGLGSCVAEKMAEAGNPARLVRIGLQDTFAHGASRPYLMREYGIDACSLIAEAEKLMSTEFGITPEDIRGVSLPVITRGGNVEDL